ncbi:carbamoyl-phosphate synthase, small subunit [Marvinbryantia formatexigens DSM 14469]|uniref:Carbamoyl phosphate synthase small chain n=2 Tax=Marvinbryantia TaxID=248744 RepID=C6LKS3_9FIRM|nr:carbamoyl-phosphate synthase, small subunit [Marvinbryantia formatexigens DSM 14469]
MKKKVICLLPNGYFCAIILAIWGVDSMGKRRAFYSLFLRDSNKPGGNACVPGVRTIHREGMLAFPGGELYARRGKGNFPSGACRGNERVSVSLRIHRAGCAPHTNTSGKAGWTMKAFLILEDGTVFTGQSIGADREVISEIVFNTSMTGYLEVLTDPSYAGQAVVMTYPLIGNYGICTKDMESERPWPDAYIVRELSRIPSNFRSEGTIQDFLLKYNIPGISGIDTRALTKILREKGTMNGMLTTNEKFCLEEVLPQIAAYRTGKVVEKVTCAEKYVLEGDGPKVALLDLGAKRNIARSLNARGCQVTVYPALTKAEEIIADAPDGIMLSNGPGDPKECVSIIEEIRKLYQTDIPIFAICLGHQLMALANGADTYKMKYGHRGGNHPVKDLKTGRVYISSQNHGYVVDTKNLDASVAVPAFTNVNDGTNEGLAYTGKNIFTVQFHPEACPGPQDSGYLFDRFMKMMEVDR